MHSKVQVQRYPVLLLHKLHHAHKDQQAWYDYMLQLAALRSHINVPAQSVYNLLFPIICEGSKLMIGLGHQISFCKLQFWLSACRWIPQPTWVYSVGKQNLTTWRSRNLKWLNMAKTGYLFSSGTMDSGWGAPGERPAITHIYLDWSRKVMVGFELFLR